MNDIPFKVINGYTYYITEILKHQINQSKNGIDILYFVKWERQNSDINDSYEEWYNFPNKNIPLLIEYNERNKINFNIQLNKNDKEKNIKSPMKYNKYGDDFIVWNKISNIGNKRLFNVNKDGNTNSKSKQKNKDKKLMQEKIKPKKKNEKESNKFLKEIQKKIIEEISNQSLDSQDNKSNSNSFNNNINSNNINISSNNENKDINSEKKNSFDFSDITSESLNDSNDIDKIAQNIKINGIVSNKETGYCDLEIVKIDNKKNYIKLNYTNILKLPDKIKDPMLEVLILNLNKMKDKNFKISFKKQSKIIIKDLALEEDSD